MRERSLAAGPHTNSHTFDSGRGDFGAVVAIIDDDECDTTPIARKYEFRLEFVDVPDQWQLEQDILDTKLFVLMFFSVFFVEEKTERNENNELANKM